MLPKYNPNNPILLESIVCFTDILGFSQLIINSPNRQSGNQLLGNLHSILTSKYNEIRQSNPHAHIKTFTDNVILAYPKFDDGEGQSGSLFTSFIDYQLVMTLNRYFLRGGIALGDYYGDTDFAYGPALIDAYQLESNATYPRIVLSNEMVKMVSKHLDYYASASDSPQFLHLLLDTDGMVFINYLYGLHEMFELTGDETAYIQKIQEHRDVTITNLSKYSTDPDKKIYFKYEWVAQYHNYYCDKFIDKSTIQQHGLKIPGIKNRKFSRISNKNTVLI